MEGQGHMQRQQHAAEWPKCIWVVCEAAWPADLLLQTCQPCTAGFQLLDSIRTLSEHNTHQIPIEMMWQAISMALPSQH